MKPLIAFILLLMVIPACGQRYAKVVEPARPRKAPLPDERQGPPCYTVNGVRYYPLPDSVGYSETGLASWYGKKFHGRPTSSGEIFDMYKISAAHKTLPLGTFVRVENLDSNKSLVVRINDRGPFVKGRIIDLSYAAAKEIGLLSPGLARVKVTALAKEIRPSGNQAGSVPVLEVSNLNKGDFSVQIGSFQNEKNARNLADRLRIIFDYVDIVRYADENNRIFFRVRVSKKSSLQEAGAVEKKLKEMGFADAFVVRI